MSAQTMLERIADYLAEREPDGDGDIAVLVTSEQRDSIVIALRSADASGAGGWREALEKAKANFVYFRAFGSCEQSCDEAIVEIDAALIALPDQRAFEKSAPVIRTPHNSGERLPNGDTAGSGADTDRSFDRSAVAKLVCCGHKGCLYQGDSEDGEKCYCDTSDFNNSGIEKTVDAILSALTRPERQTHD